MRSSPSAASGGGLPRGHGVRAPAPRSGRAVQCFVARVLPGIQAGKVGRRKLRLVRAAALPEGTLCRVWRFDACKLQGPRVGAFNWSACGAR
eukprot:12796038-Alexandrium_andersonii.AAC.1